jgi:hypothetical protein
MFSQRGSIMLDGINILELVLMTAIAAVLGWKAADELKLPSIAQAVIFAVIFGLLGVHCLDLALAGADEAVEFRLGGFMHTFGFAVVGVVASWMLQSATRPQVR